MASDAQIEQRLAAVEVAVRELQQRLTVLPPAANWLERISGSFKNEPAFEEVLEYGRALRVADHPPEEADEQG
jgi:hypothetical protein